MMKKNIFTLGLALCSLAMMAQEPVAPAAPTPPVNPSAAEIVFESETVDYGTIAHNADGVREFKFKNTGKEPLIITNAKGSCGCTVPTYPKEPIAPGANGVIKVKYATNRVGAFTKTVTLTSNAKTSTKVLRIKGNVLPAEKEEPAVPLQPKSVASPSDPGN